MLKKYKYYILLFLFIATPVFNVFSQEITLKGDVNVKKFPNISFKINTYNPDSDKQGFKLLENNEEKDFEIQAVQPQIKDNSKVVLILFEDMHHRSHGNQVRDFKKVLNQALPQIVNEGDLVNLAFFDRNRDGSTPLNFVLDDYTNDTDLLLDNINNYKKPTDRFNNQISSDLYNAINDGILDLKNKYKGKNKILVVLSGGKNLELSNYGSIGDLAMLARKYKIPVYSIQYMIFEHETLDALATNSYGKFFHLQGTYKLKGDHSVATASDSLVSYMNNAVKRLYGMDYDISYKTSFDKDGQLHSIVIKNDETSKNINFKSPVCNWLCLIKKHKKLSLIIGSALLLILLLLIYLYRTIRKKQRLLKELKEKGLLDKLDEQQTALEEQKRKAEMLEQRALEEQKRRVREEEEKRQKEREQQQADAYKKIIREMKGFKGFSKLKIALPDGSTFDWSIKKPTVTIGRGSDNDLHLDHPSVSHSHCKIIYKDRQYYITDLNSSNGTSVNGKKIHEKELSNNDAIQLGKVKLLFIK